MGKDSINIKYFFRILDVNLKFIYFIYTLFLRKLKRKQIYLVSFLIKNTTSLCSKKNTNVY